MRTLIILIIIVVGGAELWKRYGQQLMSASPESVFASSSSSTKEHGTGVVVYGRNSCGVTSAMRKALTQQGVPFEYRIVDQPVVADELHAHMKQQGLSTRRYNLPVVEVNGELSIRPDAAAVVSDYLN